MSDSGRLSTVEVTAPCPLQLREKLLYQGLLGVEARLRAHQDLDGALPSDQRVDGERARAQGAGVCLIAQAREVLGRLAVAVEAGAPLGERTGVLLGLEPDGDVPSRRALIGAA